MPGRCLRVLAGAALGAVITGCGMGVFDQSRGEPSLPTSAAGPYGKPLNDLDTLAKEPYVLAQNGVSLSEPSALPGQGGGYRLWFSYREAGTPATAIWGAEIAALFADTPEQPFLVLDATEPWEQGSVAAPCVVALSESELVMFYQGGTDAPAIGRASSTDGGQSWQKYAGNPVIRDALAPGAAQEPDGRWLIYVGRPLAPGIYRAMSDDGLDFAVDEVPVLLPRTDAADAFDRDGVASPWVDVQISAHGNIRYSMFFHGTRGSGEDADTAIGFAGSFDGISWSRFATPDQAVLDEGNANELGPAAVIEPDGGVLFFSELERGAQAIAAAFHP